MYIVDIDRPRRSVRMRASLGPDEYCSVQPDDKWPSGDYLLCPAAWWYKEKYKEYAKKANEFNGKIVLVDYAREMEEKWKNKTGIKPDFLAMAEDSSPNKIRVFRFSMPEFDPLPSFRHTPMGNQVLVTMGNPPISMVKSLAKELVGRHIVWKMRQKFRHKREQHEKILCESDYTMVCPEEKDYNWPESLIEKYAKEVDFHVHIGELSFANQEMVRYGVPTYIWDGKKCVTHKRIERTKKIFEDKPIDWCTQNLIRNLHENHEGPRRTYM